MNEEIPERAKPGHGLIEKCERCGQGGNWVQACHSLRGRGETTLNGRYRLRNLCRSCHIDLLPDPQVFYPELLDDSFTFFWGAASGSAQKALRKMEESHVMVSYATKNNGRIGPEDVHFVDCGGAPDSFIQGDYAETGDYVTENSKYLDYVESVNADLWSLRDYPCEEEVLETHGRSIKEHQDMTLNRHRELLDAAAERGIRSQPVSILQGQTINDYLTHLDSLRDAGVLTDYVGIGSVCRRNKEEEIKQIITAVRDALSPSRSLHAFGVKASVLKKRGVVDALSSVDSCAWDYGVRMESQYGDGRYWWKAVVSAYLNYKEKVSNILSEDTKEEQVTLDQMGEDSRAPVHM